MLFQCPAPPASLLKHLNAVELETLASNIATAHREFISSATPAEAVAHSIAVHSFGVTLSANKRSDSSSRLNRLSCQRFWRTQINAIADAARESEAAKAGRLGSAALGLEPYCTNASLDIFLTRQSQRIQQDKSSIERFLSSTANSSYVSCIALAKKAFSRGYASIFITLTLPGAYHSSSCHYGGYSLAESHNKLNQMFTSLIASLSRQAESGEDFFGLRVAEVNVSGCPHWHVILYVKPALVPLAESRLAKIYKKLSSESSVYFERYKHEIFKVRLPKEEKLYKESVSYVFKNSYAGRATSRIPVLDALRQRVALSMYGKTQFQFIGSKGRISKIQALRRFAKRDPEITGIASDLAIRNKGKEGRQHYLKTVMGLLDGAANEYKLVNRKAINSYGEEVKRVVGVIHSPITTEIDAKTQSCCDAKEENRGITRNYSRLEVNQERKCMCSWCMPIRASPSITKFSRNADCAVTCS